MTGGGDAVVRAAGGVVVRRGRGGATEVLVVHRPKYGDWTFPKGKNDPGEADEAAALREVEEEAGIVCDLGADLAVTEYVDSQGRPKRVRYFAMRPLAGAFRPHEEVDRIAWLRLDDARARLTYARDRPLLERAAPLPPPLYLVRHASAGHRSRWGGDDTLRPLDERGSVQAAGLVEQLAEAPLERLVSSPLVRCVQTLEPLAAALGLPVERRVELAEGAGEVAALALAHELAGTAAALCSHGDVLAELLGAPGRKGSTRVADLDGGGLRVRLELEPPGKAR